MKRMPNVLTVLKGAPLHVRLFGGIALVLAASASQSVFMYRTTIDSVAADAWVQHTETVLALAGVTRSALLKMAADYRGFLLTGDGAFVKSYTAAAESYASDLAMLEGLTADNPPQVARWQELEQRGTAWQREVIEPGIAARRTAGAWTATGQDALAADIQLGEREVDDIAHLLTEAIGVEQVLLEQRYERTVASSALLAGELEWGTFAVLGVGLVIATVFARSLARAIARERAGARRYRQMFENNPSVKLLIDPTSGAIIEANQAACDFYGYSHANLLRRRVSDICTLPSNGMLEVLARIGTDERASVRACQRLATGALRDVEIQASAISVDEAVGGRMLLYAVVNDVTERNQAEARLRLKTGLLEARGEASPDGILAVAPDGRILSFNRRFAGLCGLSAAVLAAAVDEVTLGELMDQVSDPQEFLARAASLFDHPEEPSHEEVALVDGRTFERHSAPVQGTDGRSYGRVWFFREITERKHAETAAHKAQEFLAAILESVGVGIVACDAHGVLTLFNEATRTFHGLPEQPLLAEQWAEHYALYEADGTTPMAVERIPLFRALQGEHVRNAEMMIIPRQGRARTLVAEGRALRDPQGHSLGAVVAMHDISERKRAEEALRHQALHDDLTGLPNRMLLQDRLSNAIVTGQRDHTAVALLLIDLDRFKEINDTFGHHYGDVLLHQIGPRLSGMLRTSDTVARLGGDEFAILLPATDASTAVPIARLLLRALEAPFVLDGQAVEIGGSIGVTGYPAHGSDAATLLRQADVAMYAAKRAQSGIVVYAAEHDHHTADRLALGGELRLAIENSELFLQYQPKVDLTGRLAGVEALVRWRHPHRGMIAPDEFIGLAEHIGLIKPLTRWVLDAALRQCRTWLDTGVRIHVAVNVSMHDLHDDTLPDTVARTLVAHGVPPEYLGIEITEGAIMSDAGRALSVLTRLRALGVIISVDDFGTGYSSLAYLKRLPIDELKIDRSFVKNIATDEEDTAIVRSTIGLGHELGLTVVAEGVEDQACWDRLRQFGCDLAQGYFIARPLSAPDLDRWLIEARQGLADQLEAA